MATTTPNYGWTVPTSSDLVKNGATAIETLGDSVDESLWNSGYGQAGKNKIINGDFTINQRAFTTTTTNGAYGFDRWTNALTTGGGTVTFSAQTFTLGAAPVAGYESTNFYRCVTSGQVNTDARATFRQNIESVKTFAGQTITVSFYAKAATGTPNLNVEILQVFGSGGSPSAEVSTVGTKQAITTSWARYSWTIAVPSISGKTIGTSGGDMLRLNIWASAGSTRNAESGTLGIQNNTFDIWGVQAEYGSTATPFQTATGTIQGELDACMRYYYRSVTNGTASTWFASGFAYNSTRLLAFFKLPVRMRVNPTSIETSGTAADYWVVVGTTVSTATSVPTLDTSNWDNVLLNLNTTGLTAGQGGLLGANSTNNAYIGFNAEL
jgi:hypothetical protein